MQKQQTHFEEFPIDLTQEESEVLLTTIIRLNIIDYLRENNFKTLIDYFKHILTNKTDSTKIQFKPIKQPNGYRKRKIHRGKNKSVAPIIAE